MSIQAGVTSGQTVVVEATSEKELRVADLSERQLLERLVLETSAARLGLELLMKVQPGLLLEMAARL